MEELTTVLAVFGEMAACIALGYEMRVVAEMRERERKERREKLTMERMKRARNEIYSNNSGTCNSL